MSDILTKYIIKQEIREAKLKKKVKCLEHSMLILKDRIDRALTVNISNSHFEETVAIRGAGMNTTLDNSNFNDSINTDGG